LLLLLLLLLGLSSAATEVPGADSVVCTPIGAAIQLARRWASTAFRLLALLLASLLVRWRLRW